MHVGIIGDIRTGKTLLMVLFTHLFSKKRVVKANLKRLEHPNFEYLSIRDFLHLDEFNHADVYIDEIYAWLESRMSFDDVNLALSYFALQSGKRDVNIVWTAQLMMSVDIRYRFLANVIFSCVHNTDLKRFEYKRYVKRIIGEPPFQEIKYQFVDMFYLYESNAKLLYDKYDTFEVIEPRKKKRMEWALIESDEIAFEEEIQNAKSKIAKLIENGEQVTREKVRIYMNKLNIPLRFESDIYYPLKEDFTYYYESD